MGGGQAGQEVFFEDGVSRHSFEDGSLKFFEGELSGASVIGTVSLENDGPSSDLSTACPSVTLEKNP